MNIFITGISSGIGKALAKYFVSKGNNVWGVARRENLIKKLVEECDSSRLRCEVADIGNLQQVQKIVNAMRDAGFIPDVAILNAGSTSVVENPITDDIHYTEMIRNNLMSVLHCCNALANLMNKDGQIIYVSSLFALFPDSYNPAYSASKCGASMAIRALRLNEKSNLTYKNVYLGPIHTERSVKQKRNYIPSVEDVARYIEQKVIPSKRIEYYYSWHVKLLYCIFQFLPDDFFNRFTKFFRR